MPSLTMPSGIVQAMLGLLIAALMHATSASKHYHVNRSQFVPVNDVAALRMCQYGNLPGSWILPENNSQVSDFSMKTFPSAGGAQPNQFDVGSLPFEKDYETAPFGSRYQVFDPNCQLENLIEPYLRPKAIVPSTSKDVVRILMYSDSTDTHSLVFYIHHLNRLLGNTSSLYKQIFNGSKMHIHDRGPFTNYVTIDTGLLLAQMFIVGIDATAGHPLDNLQLRIQRAKDQWPELICKDPPCADPPPPPDIIALHNIHWTLLGMISDTHPDHHLGKEPILPPEFMERFMVNLSFVAQEIRTLFPTSLLVMHTAVMPRHNYSSGLSNSKRAFVNRNFISQLNDAHRAVARFLHMPLIDWDHICRGLVPNQVLFDDIHPQDWITWELYNILLNLIKNWKLPEYKRAKSQDDLYRRLTLI